MIQQAIASPDPVIFLEPKRLYHSAKAAVDLDVAPAPLWSSRVVREGTEATLVAYGPTVATCLAAAEEAERQGRSVGVIDLRTLSPLDLGPVYAAARSTGHVVVVHEAHANLGMGSEIAARVTEECFDALNAPVLRVGGWDTPYPPSRVEEDFLPDVDRVLSAVDRSWSW
jgi:pyruvate dehydrogenase E1 component beta subunit